MMDIRNSESLTSSFETICGPWNQTGLWGLVQRQLLISSGRAKNTLKYLRNNLGSIAIENLKGQCRNEDDYSCNDNKNKILLPIVNRATEEQVILTVDESLVSTLEKKKLMSVLPHENGSKEKQANRVHASQTQGCRF